MHDDPAQAGFFFRYPAGVTEIFANAHAYAVLAFTVVAFFLFTRGGEAFRRAGPQDLSGSGCECLIPAAPPREAIEARRTDANTRFRGDYVHTISDGKKKKGKRKESRNKPGKGYRPRS